MVRETILENVAHLTAEQLFEAIKMVRNLMS